MGLTLSTPNTPEYDKKYELTKRRPHRCNDRMEDFCKVLASGYTGRSEHLSEATRLLWRCFKSEPGQEPLDAYRLLPLNDPHARQQ